MVRMEIHELLDRLELLSNNDNVSDIRRAVIDKDFNSIFRLLEKETNTQLLPAIKKHYNILGDALSQGQIKSKQWLLSKIKGIDLGMVFICAGWYGILATMMFEDKNVYVDKIRSFDLDDSCCNIAEDFNKYWAQDNWKFKALTQNILDINYTEHSWTFWSKKNNRQSYPITDKPNTIINTSIIEPIHINLPRQDLPGAPGLRGWRSSRGSLLQKPLNLMLILLFQYRAS